MHWLKVNQYFCVFLADGCDRSLALKYYRPAFIGHSALTLEVHPRCLTSSRVFSARGRDGWQSSAARNGEWLALQTLEVLRVKNGGFRASHFSQLSLLDLPTASHCATIAPNPSYDRHDRP
jgi:hypothetical protein